MTKSNSMNHSQMLSFTSRTVVIPLLEKITIKRWWENCLRKSRAYIAKRILEYENINSGTICIEITISQRKWCLTLAYMALYDNNKATILMELIKSLCKIARKYENTLIVGGYKTFDHNELLRNLDQKLINSNMHTMMDNNMIYLDQFIKVLG